jgi:hypothetical protein
MRQHQQEARRQGLFSSWYQYFFFELQMDQLCVQRMFNRNGKIQQG